MLGFGFVELLLQISIIWAQFLGEKYDLESSQVKRGWKASPKGPLRMTQGIHPRFKARTKRSIRGAKKSKPTSDHHGWTVEDTTDRGGCHGQPVVATTGRGGPSPPRLFRFCAILRFPRDYSSVFAVFLDLKRNVSGLEREENSSIDCIDSLKISIEEEGRRRRLWRQKAKFWWRIKRSALKLSISFLFCCFFLSFSSISDSICLQCLV